MIRRSVIAIVVLVFAVASLAQAQTGSGVDVTQDISYGPLPIHHLDVCEPHDGTDLPGVVLLHGGGWQAGDKRDILRFCRALAGRGIVGIGVNYTLGDRHIPSTQWPAQLADVQLAVRWARAHARELRLAPTKLCAMGYSAGGHLAVFLGVTATSAPGDLARFFDDQSSKVACVVDNFGPVDLLDPSYGGGRHPAFFSMRRDESPALYKEASPLYFVTADTSPMLIMQGSDDDQVPLSQSARLAQALRGKSVPVELITYPGGHDYGGMSPAQLDKIIVAQSSYLLTRHGSLE